MELTFLSLIPPKFFPGITRLLVDTLHLWMTYGGFGFWLRFWYIIGACLGVGVGVVHSRQKRFGLIPGFEARYRLGTRPHRTIVYPGGSILEFVTISISSFPLGRLKHMKKFSQILLSSSFWCPSHCCRRLNWGERVGWSRVDPGVLTSLCLPLLLGFFLIICKCIWPLDYIISYWKQIHSISYLVSE